MATPLPWPQPDRTSFFAQYSLRVQDRDALQAQLQAPGILSALPFPMLPLARQIAREILSLPCAHVHDQIEPNPYRQRYRGDPHLTQHGITWPQ